MYVKSSAKTTSWIICKHTTVRRAYPILLLLPNIAYDKKTPKLIELSKASVQTQKLRDHKKTQARGYRPAVEPSDKAASDKAAAKAAAKAAVKAAAKAATKQNGDRSREAKAAAKARIRSQARREARRAHK